MAIAHFGDGAHWNDSDMLRFAAKSYTVSIDIELSGVHHPSRLPKNLPEYVTE